MVRARDERPTSTLMSATFDEMRRILRDLPGPDLAATTEGVRRQPELTKPPGALGRLGGTAEWLAAWHGSTSPRAARPGGSGADWAGPGTGVKGAILTHKIAIIDDALAYHKKAIAERDPLGLLAAVGGEELAAIAGAVLAARMGHIPVLLDGYACTAAASVLYAADRRALDHCLVAHRSAEPGHTPLLPAIGHRPLLDMDMRLGEASAAALAGPPPKAAPPLPHRTAGLSPAGARSQGAPPSQHAKPNTPRE